VDILDITVPVTELERVMRSIEEIAKRDEVFLPVLGHVGDGNLHINIMSGRVGVPEHAEALRDEIYHIAMEAGGVITGEHGIGKIRTEKLQVCLSKKEIELMRAIKRIFDPNGILNPGTKIPA